MNTRRFIAGAICPECKGIDKIHLEKLPSAQKIECIACGFTKTQPLSMNEDNDTNKV